MDPEGVLRSAAKNNVKILGLRFVQLLRISRHAGFSVSELSEDPLMQEPGSVGGPLRACQRMSFPRATASEIHLQDSSGR